MLKKAKRRHAPVIQGVNTTRSDDTAQEPQTSNHLESRYFSSGNAHNINDIRYADDTVLIAENVHD